MGPIPSGRSRNAEVIPRVDIEQVPAMVASLDSWLEMAVMHSIPSRRAPLKSSQGCGQSTRSLACGAVVSICRLASTFGREAISQPSCALPSFLPISADDRVACSGELLWIAVLERRGELPF